METHQQATVNNLPPLQKTHAQHVIKKNLQTEIIVQSPCFLITGRETLGTTHPSLPLNWVVTAFLSIRDLRYGVRVRVGHHAFHIFYHV